MTTINLKDSFKAYDVRGIVGETITHETVRATGAAFVDVLGLAGQTVLVGGDMRPSSPEFMDAFAEGATARGANVQKSVSFQPMCSTSRAVLRTLRALLSLQATTPPSTTA